MIVRLARPDEGAVLAALEALQPRAAGWGGDGFDTELAQSCARIWCAQEGNEMIGFVALRFAADMAEILNVAVCPARVRRGVGRALLNAAVDDLRSLGVQHVTLEAEEGNAPAERLYAAAGFAPLGLRRNFYGPGRNGRIWGLNL